MSPHGGRQIFRLGAPRLPVTIGSQLVRATTKSILSAQRKKPISSQFKKRELKTAVPTTPQPKKQGPKGPGLSGWGTRPILPGPWQINAVAFLLLTLATVGLYAGDLYLGFFSVDDPGYVVNNPWI